jgi:hypothetical protein
MTRFYLCRKEKEIIYIMLLFHLHHK